MGDLVPVERGSKAPARRDEDSYQPAPRREYYSPFTEFDDLWNRMVSRFFAPPVFWTDWSRDWRPAVDLEETDDAWIFEVELPGARREDIEVNVSETELIITGTMEERDRVGAVRHRARRSGSFEYRTSLPAGVDPGKVDARFDNGLLTVSVQRPARSKLQRIMIN
ncbi:MAG: Hsp20/alpha crystallin family protein [Actinobacteria bacterium]|nr:Hsp20/alpha crystallin family protein [Actinomycetota bacterium]MBO0836923.1 Hsp20/alpha crystallin family protein [Actinomycetota bacterium]